IGGLTPGSRNIISGNTYVGLSLLGTLGTEIFGNYIGLAPDGLTSVSNSYGIYLQSCQQTQIGGTTSGARNAISGNYIGCNIYAGGDNVIQGNFVGTDASGTLARCNLYGVAARGGGTNNIIG